MAQKLISGKQAAQILTLSYARLMALAVENKIPSVRVGGNDKARFFDKGTIDKLASGGFRKRLPAGSRKPREKTGKPVGRPRKIIENNPA